MGLGKGAPLMGKNVTNRRNKATSTVKNKGADWKGEGVKSVRGKSYLENGGEILIQTARTRTSGRGPVSSCRKTRRSIQKFHS